DAENATLALRGTIPLLRGAGMVNLEPLIASERGLVYSMRDFEQFRRSFAVELASRYFRILSSQQRIQNRFLNYQSFRDLTDKTAALFAAGLVNALEVQRALQSLLSAEDALNDALEAYANEVDNFKVFIGMPVEQELRVVPVNLLVRGPDVRDPGVVDLALRHRLDLQTARDRLDDARRIVDNASNGLLPDLDLSLAGEIGNREDTPARAIDSRTLNYSARLDLDLPVDRVAERNTYRRSLITLEQRSRTVDELSELIRADVRRARRGIEAAEFSVQIQRRNMDVAIRRLEYANELLLGGQSSDSRNVVEAQNALLAAQDRYDQAQADLQIQTLQFLRDTGLLRVDPESGSLGLALDRARQGNDARPMND
ncbi:MAG TPA: TolC family protein, partial [Tepidisphaeraceae bacterium]|nr:TolC family protein [Tepidisphaeraceae bacterium]